MDPGSYMIRDYARQFVGVDFHGAEAVKTAKDRWRVRVPKSGIVKVSYDAYAFERRSARTGFRTRTRSSPRGALSRRNRLVRGSPSPPRPRA
jgi:predicted metalloprotease with PDZ domain